MLKSLVHVPLSIPNGNHKLSVVAGDETTWVVDEHIVVDLRGEVTAVVVAVDVENNLFAILFK